MVATALIASADAVYVEISAVDAVAVYCFVKAYGQRILYTQGDAGAVVDHLRGCGVCCGDSGKTPVAGRLYAIARQVGNGPSPGSNMGLIGLLRQLGNLGLQTDLIILALLVAANAVDEEISTVDRCTIYRFTETNGNGGIQCHVGDSAGIDHLRRSCIGL